MAGTEICNQLVVIAAAFQFYTNKSRAGFFIMFLNVFEPGNVIIWTQHIIYKFFQSSRTLGKPYEEIMFQTFELQRSFLNFLHPVNVIVTAAYYTNHSFTGNFVRNIIKACDRKNTYRFYHYCIFIV